MSSEKKQDHKARIKTELDDIKAKISNARTRKELQEIRNRLVGVYAEANDLGIIVDFSLIDEVDLAEDKLTRREREEYRIYKNKAAQLVDGSAPKNDLYNLIDSAEKLNNKYDECLNNYSAKLDYAAIEEDRKANYILDAHRMAKHYIDDVEHAERQELHSDWLALEKNRTELHKQDTERQHTALDYEKERDVLVARQNRLMKERMALQQKMKAASGEELTELEQRNQALGKQMREMRTTIIEADRKVSTVESGLERILEVQNLHESKAQARQATVKMIAEADKARTEIHEKQAILHHEQIASMQTQAAKGTLTPEQQAALNESLALVKKSEESKRRIAATSISHLPSAELQEAAQKSQAAKNHRKSELERNRAALKLQSLFRKKRKPEIDQVAKHIKLTEYADIQTSTLAPSSTPAHTQQRIQKRGV